MSTSTYPVISAVDFGKFAVDELKNNPYPDFIKRNYYWKWGGDGLIMYVIYDIEEGNEEAALKDINSRGAKAAQSVKGLVGNIEPLMNIEDIFSLFSMTAPTV
jgi:hypothetical protein